MTDDDPTLVRRALRGDAGAAEALFARHYDAVWRVALSVTTTRAAADDVSQSAFERAFRSLRDWTGEGEFGAWLRRITVNQALDHLRRARRRTAAEIPLDTVTPEWEDSSPDPEVAAAIRLLDPDRRTVVVLHHWHGYTLQEVADMLGIPAGTAQSRLARAMRDLRERLGVTT